MKAAMRGFSILEIMIVVAIIGVILTIGVPSFQTWIQNLQIRTGAEGVMAGLQITKNEAIRRNVNMVLTLDTTGGAATSWRMNLESDVDGTPMQNRDAAEGSSNVTALLAPDGAFRVTFTGLGRVGKNIDGSDPLTQIDLDNPMIPNPTDRRKLRIMIPTGGAVRMCDPLVAAGDPRACP